MVRPSPYQIAAFGAAAREQSMTRAAHRLGVSQSSVTQHVAKLERLMGAKLFVRRRQGLELTAAGRELFALTDRLRVFEELVAERIASYGTLTAGHLKVIANTPRPALEAVARFAELYPEVRIDFEVCDWASSMRALRERSVDVGVITQPEPLDGLNILEVARSTYALHVRKSHRLAARSTVSLRDLQHETLLLLEEGSLTRRVVQAKLRAHDVTIAHTMDLRTHSLAKEAILHGLGHGVLLCDSMYPTPEIGVVPIDEMPERYGQCLVTDVEKRELLSIERFLAVAEASLAPRCPCK